MTAELVFSVAGIYACFLTWGILQERVTTTPYYGHAVIDDGTSQQPAAYFRHFVFLNAVQSLCACAVAYVYLRFVKRQSLTPVTMKRKADRSALMWQYAKVALLSSIASPFGYAALRHIDYPTLILGKSCKLVPVMFMSFVLHRKTFDWFKYASVLLITVGVSAFMLLHSQRHVKSTSSDGGSIDSSLLGLALLLVNLLLDGATNSTQDQIFRAWRVTGGQMMVWMNACSTALMVVFMSVVQPFLVSSGSGALTALGFGVSMTPTLAASELVQGVAFLRAYPQALFDVLLFGVVGSVGQIFIFHTLERFGSILLVTINVTRKMFSMLLSVAWFGHVLSLGQWASVATVFAGIGLEALMARRSKLTVSVRDDKGKVTRRRSLDEDVDAAEEVHEASVVVEKRKARSVPAGGNAVTRTPVKAASSSRRMSPRRR